MKLHTNKKFKFCYSSNCKNQEQFHFANIPMFSCFRHDNRNRLSKEASNDYRWKKSGHPRNRLKNLRILHTLHPTFLIVLQVYSGDHLCMYTNSKICKKKKHQNLVSKANYTIVNCISQVSTLLQIVQVIVPLWIYGCLDVFSLGHKITLETLCVRT